MEYMDKNTNKEEITKLANQTFQENRLKETMYDNFEKDL